MKNKKRIVLSVVLSLMMTVSTITVSAQVIPTASLGVTACECVHVIDACNHEHYAPIEELSIRCTLGFHDWVLLGTTPDGWRWYECSRCGLLSRL